MNVNEMISFLDTNLGGNWQLFGYNIEKPSFTYVLWTNVKHHHFEFYYDPRVPDAIDVWDSNGSDWVLSTFDEVRKIIKTYTKLKNFI